MRYILSTIAGVLAALSAEQAGAQASSCQPAGPPLTTLLNFARSFVAPAPDDSMELARRNRLGITSTRAQDVAAVSNSRTCSRVVDGINAHLGTPGTARRFHVVQLGREGYMAYDEYPLPVGLLTYRPVYLLTRSFSVRTTIAR
jgi:hypothetical protein